MDIFLNQPIQFYVNNISSRLTFTHYATFPHNMPIVSRPQITEKLVLL